MNQTLNLSAAARRAKLRRPVSRALTTSRNRLLGLKTMLFAVQDEVQGGAWGFRSKA
jgi:hypothetical protein